MNPGTHYADAFVFDVPHGAQAAAVTLHGDYGTPGATFSATR